MPSLLLVALITELEMGGCGNVVDIHDNNYNLAKCINIFTDEHLNKIIILISFFYKTLAIPQLARYLFNFIAAMTACNESRWCCSSMCMANLVKRIFFLLRIAVIWASARLSYVISIL